jgi:small subunit ribosomal protein S17
MAEKKGGKPTEKKSAAAKVADVAKSAVKTVTDAVKHPTETAKKAVAAVAHAAGVDAPQKGQPTPRANTARGQQRKLLGVVRSDKMDKTVVVEVTSLKRDPVYGKYLRDRMRYKAHDEKNQYKTGDRVEIKEHRPLSSQKRWIVSRLIEAAKVE